MNKVVVIGGGVAAKGFVITSKKLNKDVTHTVIRSNRRAPVPCGIPYALGVLKDPNDNLSADTEIIDQGSTLVIDDVISINRDEKKVYLKNNDPVAYDQLVLATGSNPIKPKFEGIDLEGIYIIEKDLDKTVDLRAKVEAAKSVVIVGGGFIGVELADEISHLSGKKITLVEYAPYCLSVAFEAKYSIEIEEKMKLHGINVLTGISVQGFSGTGAVQKVKLSNGEFIDADIVFLVIGAVPNSSLAKEAGLELDSRSAIKVDEYQRTSDPNIMAIGDCASKIDLFTNEVSNIRLASIASKEGRNAAYNLLGKKKLMSPVGITNLFSTAVKGDYFAAAGMTRQQCEDAGYGVIQVEVSEFNRHPGKLPGAVKTRGTFFFDNSDLKLLGAQLAGNDQVAEMINGIGIAIQNNATAYNLFAYNYATQPMGTFAPNKYLLHLAATQAIVQFEN